MANIDVATQTYVDPKTGQTRNAKTGAVVGTPTAPSPAQVDARATAAASPASIISSSPVRRFTTTPGTANFASEQDRLLGNLPTAQPTESDIQKIKDEQLSSVQRQLDAIDQTTASMLATEGVAAEGRLGRGRGINARSGVLGSDMGERRTGEITELNRQNTEAIKASQQAQKVAILDKAQQRAADIVAQKKNEALQNTETYLNYLASKQQEARQDVKALANAGVELSSLQADEYQALLDQSGYENSFLFDAVYNSQMPKNAQQDYEYVNLGSGKVVRFNKAGGAPEYFDYSVPEGFQFKMAGDIPVFINESTQEVKVATPAGAGAEQFVKETELDTFTNAAGKRVSVMYNPVSKKTRTIVLGSAKDESGAAGGYPTGFKPQAFEVSAVSQYLSVEGAKQGQSKADIDAAIKKAQQDPQFFYATLGAVTSDTELSNRFYKPVTMGIPASLMVQP